MVRTRFAPSPTGYLHIGGARTALFSWAYARKHQGVFVLRVEDTDLERSSEESVRAILEGMEWLGLDYDEGPFYQMQRMDRYKQVLQQLLEEGKAYHCYASKEELETTREQQMAAGLKPRYDRRWRPETGKTLPPPPTGVPPVVRFRTPLEGAVVIDDLVKGRVVVHNGELDDLIIARADGTPTYNFCVVVDDWDMEITHVIRGDDHLNNTPRQINILQALGAPIPQYAHVPMILGADGERLSKRHGAVSVMQYQEDGYLPEALLNYLARLGWASGDEEVFSLDKFVELFDLEGVSRSPAKFNPEKLLWLNQQYLKNTDDARLAAGVVPFLATDGCDTSAGPALARVVALLKERANTLEELADAAVYFYRPLEPAPEVSAEHLTPEALSVMKSLHDALTGIDWNRETLSQTLKAVAAAHGLKMPKIAMPLRLLVTGTTQTPSIDAVLELLGREEVLARLGRQLEKHLG